MNNHIAPENTVKIEIYDPDGHRAATYEGSGYHNIDEAVTAAYEGTEPLNMPPQDYVYRVTDLDRGTSARYRFDAGGVLRILPEER